ncbi:MAG: Na(+)-translocating NADH-quinone reductase subunit A [Bacteroidales bacterium]
MSKVIKIRKGLDLPLVGEAEKVIIGYTARTYAVKPIDFPGLVPRLLVKEGDGVKAGSPLFADKTNERVILTSPVSGRVVEIVRGEKRKLLEVRIEKSDTEEFESFRKANPNALSADEIKEELLKSGLWPLIRQRPYAVVANPADHPKAIHISAFDTAPLAPDYDFILHGKGDEFQTGLDALVKLAPKVHLNVRAGEDVSKVLLDAKNVQINTFEGPHPAGNPGIQIHHIDPVNKGEVVWYLRATDVLLIGRLFLEGRYRPEKIVSLTGGGVKKPQYLKMTAGASMEGIASQYIKEGDYRIISGNVLTGTNIGHNGYLGFYDWQITVIKEGKHHEFFGWALPGTDKLSASRTFLSRLFPNKKFDPDTNMHGGERAFVLTGQYEKVLPMDIYPVYLIKAILAQNIDKMEQLGIYEVAEEDFALCEFVCASKIEVQSIIRQGLYLMRKEMS